MIPKVGWLISNWPSARQSSEPVSLNGEIKNFGKVA